MSKEGYEQEYVKQAFDTNWVAPLGENVDKFEQEVAKEVGTDYAVALSSGTAALQMALKAANVADGDIVLCQSLTFVATVNPIIYQGATPVFIDSDWDSWNMDPVLLKQALEKYPQAKAVVVVHLYGLPAKMQEITALCQEYEVSLIEDAAESLGSYYKAQATGTFGEYGIYSFNGNKIITTSGGGMLVGQQEERMEKVRFWATQARDPARHYQHSEVGHNYRLSNILAGIGRGQLKVLAERVKKKKEIYAFYQEQLQDYSEITFMPENEWADANYWLSCFYFNDGKSPLLLIEALEREGIEARPIWKPMHLQPVFAEYEVVGGAVSEALFNSGICLPSDTKLTKNELARVVNSIKKNLANQ
ncbi:aminotransferase class I/II-fold pyridoxal phosphate-dependent enzyme [Enterococcus ureasiticus]|uniref:Aminotransferase DegT n=1 Tax=Enterococcus ureasiticus TaxID=903984 RepID=A0A1E5GHX0_9ENTE|nr:aminotransferase DegT [Enterococcus ureasiticus]